MPAPLPLATRLQLHRYPRLGYQIQSYSVLPNLRGQFQRLQYVDLAVVDMELVRNNPTWLGTDGVLRTLNPNIVLVDYFSLWDIHPKPGVQAPLTLLYNLGPGGAAPVAANWAVKMANGQPLRLYDFGADGWSTVLNLTIPAARAWWCDFTQANVGSKQMFDGHFVDWGGVTSLGWLANAPQNAGGGGIDLNGDGIAESGGVVDTNWRTAVQSLHNELRTKSSTKFIIGNAGGEGQNSLLPCLNGMMIEGCFRDDQWTAPNVYGSWANQMRSYVRYCDAAYFPRASLMLKLCPVEDQPNGGTLSAVEYEKARFALASTCLSDGYFACQNPGQYADLHLLDEYSVSPDGFSVPLQQGRGWLGVPLDQAVAADDPDLTLVQLLNTGNPADAEAHVYVRFFERGIVIVNPTATAWTIPIPADFRAMTRKIDGPLDPTGQNDGATLDETHTLQPRTALFLRLLDPWEREQPIGQLSQLRMAFTGGRPA